jgi:uncharacterized membrane protein YeaQ/YmgE (transglycosylase-associated protein family)
VDLINLIITLASGAIGGNIAGAASKDNSLGTLGNSVAGAIGGGAGNWIAQAIGILGTVAAASGNEQAINFTHLLGSIASSAVGGAILTLIAGYFKNSSSK